MKKFALLSCVLSACVQETSELTYAEACTEFYFATLDVCHEEDAQSKREAFAAWCFPAERSMELSATTSVDLDACFATLPSDVNGVAPCEGINSSVLAYRMLYEGMEECRKAFYWQVF